MRSLPALLLAATAAPAADPPSGNAYLDFVRGQAAALRAKDAPPATLADWGRQRAELRRQLVEAWGGFPAEPCPLDPQTHGVLRRDGYRVEKVTFQTRPGVRMTANVYVPDRPGKLPAILHVHGHWRGAKQDPVVQARCVGSAKLGFVALVVDAFGAGERGVGTALGEYHGEMTAATLLPAGLPLSGLQAYENRRAVDYLLTRPEVDGDRIGITGASGGGNQTMYAGAMDDRLKAVVPVCSVGNYQAYLGAACCLCEVVPGALRFTEEGGLLAMVAPRALMVVSATKDARQFSPGEAKRSLALAEPVFRLHGRAENVRHAVFESGHDYSRPMREAMYGWMAKHLRGEGDGGPIPEPEIRTEDPEALRCYPGATRPAEWVTIPKFAAAEGRKLLAARTEPKTAAEWTEAAKGLRAALAEKVLGGFPVAKGTDVSMVGFDTAASSSDTHGFSSEANLRMTATVNHGPARRAGQRMAVLLNLDGGAGAASGPLARELHGRGYAVAHLSLRATGEHGWKSDRVGRAADHNTAEWALWLGRPLLGQWVHDVRRLLDAVGRKDVTLIGEGPAGLVALAAAAVDDRITAVAAVGSLASFVSDEPFVGQRLGVIPPGILRHVGDVAQLAALIAPKRVVIAGGVRGGGQPLPLDRLRDTFRPTAGVYKLLDAEKRLTVTDATDPTAVLAVLLADGPEAIFEPGAKLKVESAGGTGGEGPAWDPELGVLSSGNGDINRLAPDGKSSVYRAKAGTNGLLFLRDGTLVACDSESRRVVRIGRTGELAVLADRYGGKRFNTPNDLTVDSKGRLYFSDPRYGRKDGMEQRDAAGDTVEGVYRIDPDGTVTRVIGREVERANGVLVSADDRYLFVADNNNDAVGGARKLWRFDLKPDGTIDAKSKKLLHDWGTGRGPDGLKQDERGRLYVAAGLNRANPPFEPAGDVPGGIYVIDPDSGAKLAFQPVPTDEVTNCAFGGADRRTLYITGGGTLYSIRTTTPGRVVWPVK